MAVAADMMTEDVIDQEVAAQGTDPTLQALLLGAQGTDHIHQALTEIPVAAVVGQEAHPTIVKVVLVLVQDPLLVPLPEGEKEMTMMMLNKSNKTDI